MLMTRKAWLQGAAATLALAAAGMSGSAMAQQPTELRVGLIPSEDAQAMMRASQQVMDQLAAKTGLKIKPFVANDYNGVIEAMRSGKIDVAYFGPFSYVLASQLANAEAFAIPVAKKSGKSSYNSIIISKKDKGLATVPQLQGKTFAFVDPSSASGHLFPKAGLKGEGIDTDKYFSRVIFSGSHDASIMAVANGKVEHAKLGVAVQEVNQAFAESFNLDKPEGALVASVSKGSPAEKAGLQAGDVIRQVDGQPIVASGDLPAWVGQAQPGQQAKLSIWRQGKPLELTATLGDASDKAVKQARNDDAVGKGQLGLSLRPLDPQERRAAGLNEGLVIEQARGPAAAAGVQPGDVLLAINGAPIKDITQVRAAMAKAGKSVALLIERDGDKIFVPVRLG